MFAFFSLFAAIAHQLQDSSTPSQLRKISSEYMEANQDDFLPFLGTDDGEMMDEQQFREYCHKIKNTSLWGGSHEVDI